MGKWGGIQQGLAAIEAEKLAKKNLELSDQELELRKRAADRADKQFESDETARAFEIAKNIRSTYGGIGANSLGGGGAGSKNKITRTQVNQSMTVLSEKYGLSTEVLTELYSKGGAAGVVQAATYAENYADKFRTGNFVGDAPNLVIGEMIAGALYTDSETVEYDWDKISTELGMEVDQAVKDMLGASYTVPGAVTLTPPPLVEKPSLTDLDAADKRGIMSAESQARAESRIINGRLNTLRKKQEDQSISSTEQLELSWLVDRLGMISSAQDSFKDDVYTPLIELFGASYINTVTDYYGNLEGAPLNPAFLAASQIEITVPSRDVALNLLQAGILKPGMSVRNLATGKLIPLGE
jgi:hypothetical protein